MAVGVAADPGGLVVGRYNPAGFGQGAEDDRIGHWGAAAAAGAVQVVNRAKAKPLMALVALGGLGRVLRHIQAAVGGMGEVDVRICRAAWRLVVAGDAVHRICLGIKKVAVHASGRSRGILGNLVTPQTVVHVCPCRGIVVVVRHRVGGYSGAAGMAGAGLAEAVGEGGAEAAWGRGKGGSPPLAHVVAEGAGTAQAAGCTMGVCAAPLPVRGVGLGIGVAE